MDTTPITELLTGNLKVISYTNSVPFIKLMQCLGKALKFPCDTYGLMVSTDRLTINIRGIIYSERIIEKIFRNYFLNFCPERLFQSIKSATKIICLQI